MAEYGDLKWNPDRSWGFLIWPNTRSKFVMQVQKDWKSDRPWYWVCRLCYVDVFPHADSQRYKTARQAFDAWQRSEHNHG